MRRGLLTMLVALAALAAWTTPAMAATPTIVNTANWLESPATGGQTNNGANTVSVTVVVKHDPGVSVDQLVFDEDWDSTNDPTAVKTNISPQKPSIQGGYDYSRVTYTYSIPTSNTGMSCGPFSFTR